MQTFILGVLAGIFIYLTANFIKSGKLKLYYDKVVGLFENKVDSEVQRIIKDFEERIKQLENSNTTTTNQV